LTCEARRNGLELRLARQSGQLSTLRRKARAGKGGGFAFKELVKGKYPVPWEGLEQLARFRFMTGKRKRKEKEDGSERRGNGGKGIEEKKIYS